MKPMSASYNFPTEMDRKYFIRMMEEAIGKDAGKHVKRAVKNLKLLRRKIQERTR